MQLSEEPTYRSGPFQFQLTRSYTYPAGISDDYVGITAGTEIVAPLRPGIHHEQLFQDLSTGAEAETLLFMRNLRRVIVRHPATSRETSIELDPSPLESGEVIDLGNSRWYRTRHSVRPPADAVTDEGEIVDRDVDIVLARSEDDIAPHSVFTFFKTGETHSYPWRFSAPFEVTGGREQLLGSPYNRWLLREVGAAMVRTAPVPDIGDVSSPWNLVPVRGEDSELLSEVWIGARTAMGEVKWLPTEGGMVTASVARFAESFATRELLNGEDFADGRQWISGVPPEYARTALEQAGALRMCCHQLSRVLASGPTDRSPEWWLRSLSESLRLHQSFGDSTVTDTLLSGRCVLDQTGSPFSLAVNSENEGIICNTRSLLIGERLQSLFPHDELTVLNRVYQLPDRRTDDPNDELRRHCDDWFRTQSNLDRIDYESRLDGPTFIRRFIVEGDPEWVKAYSDELLNFVRDYLPAYIGSRGGSRRLETLAEIGKRLHVRARSVDLVGKTIRAQVPISEVYLSQTFSETNQWAVAAASVPGFWWIESSYRRSLARPEDDVGATGFLRNLGAASTFRVHPVSNDTHHGMHSFSRVTRGETDEYPNYPHDSVPFNRYSDHGLVGDYSSPDLDAWWAYTSKLGVRERSTRGEALLRTIEASWTSLDSKISTRATAYYSNGETEIDVVPAVWLWNLQRRAWIRTSTGEFDEPRSCYARTDSLQPLLDPQSDRVTAWPSVQIPAAVGLGFKTEMDSSEVIERLRDSYRNNKELSFSSANAYYRHLAKLMQSESDVIHALTRERLIFSPTEVGNWWTASDCLQTISNELPANLYPALDNYEDCHDLWNHLQIKNDPDYSYLMRFWNRLSRSLDPTYAELPSTLAISYRLADRVAPFKKWKAVQVIADGAWRESDNVFVTQLEEVANELHELGMWRWEHSAPDMVPRFLKAAGIFSPDRDGGVEIIDRYSGRADENSRDHIHRAIAGFADEIFSDLPDAWPPLAGRMHQIIQGQVIRHSLLKVQVSLKHDQVGQREVDATVPAWYEKGDVHLSELTQGQDDSVAEAILSGLQLEGQLRFGARNALTKHLRQPMRSVSALPSVPIRGTQRDLGIDSDVSPYPGEPDWGVEPPAHKPALPPKNPKPSPPKPVIPVDSYVVISDDTKNDNRDNAGGLVPRRKINLKNPSGGPADPAKPNSERPQRSNLTVEQRGVDLVTEYLLDPDGIKVFDVRKTPNVGADLRCTDGIFRELKAFSGAGSASIGLTASEFQRATVDGDQFELVIAEHVFSNNPQITVIPDPLRNLVAEPSGGVSLKQWRDSESPKRKLKLGPNPS